MGELLPFKHLELSAENVSSIVPASDDLTFTHPVTTRTIIDSALCAMKTGTIRHT